MACRRHGRQRLAGQPDRRRRIRGRAAAIRAQAAGPDDGVYRIDSLYDNRAGHGLYPPGDGIRLLLWGLVYLKDSRRLAFVVTIALAATFHKSAVILLPLAALAAAKNRVWTAFWVGLASLGMYWLFLEEQSEKLWENYVVDDYSQASQGGAIRVAMNAVPAFLFLALRHRFQMPREQHRLWFWISVMSLVCMPLVLQAPTAVDRVALYFMPIQLVVFSHLALLFHPSNRPYLRLGILAGYALVQFVWLNYAFMPICGYRIGSGRWFNDGGGQGQEWGQRAQKAGVRRQRGRRLLAGLRWGAGFRSKPKFFGPRRALLQRALLVFL